jgi:RNA polymerase sigma-19 factor, ECF subfamily
MQANNQQTEITLEYLESAFHTHYEGMYRYAYTLLQQTDPARDAVQQVFANIWEHRGQINISVSLRSYLFRSLYNHCINLKTRSGPRHVPIPTDMQESLQSPSEIMLECKELQTLIDRSIDGLPPQCKAIFLMTRVEGKSYAEIAKALAISVKTVEAQVTKALKILRKVILLHENTNHAG